MSFSRAKASGLAIEQGASATFERMCVLVEQHKHRNQSGAQQNYIYTMASIRFMCAYPESSALFFQCSQFCVFLFLKVIKTSFGRKIFKDNVFQTIYFDCAEYVRVCLCVFVHAT